MSTNNNFSDEHLNAFVDGQLDGAETNRVFEALNRDAELGLKVSELRKLKELVQYAYNNDASAKGRSTAGRSTAQLARSRLISSALAASLLAIGVTGGWFWHNALLTGGDGSISSSAAKKRGIVVQISENDPAKWDMALTTVKNVRKEFPAENMDIEIVAYGPGLAMFKKDTPLDRRLDDAARSGVKLLACGNTMKASNTTKKELSPSVAVVKAGVVEIMQKQEQGYSYIKP